MKILIDGRVLSHISITGVETYTRALLSSFQEPINIVTAVPKIKNKYLHHIWEHCVLPLKSRWYDVLFCPANIAPLWLPKKTKLVITLHDLAFLTYSESVSKLFRLYYRWLVPINIKRSDAIITISYASKNEIIRYFPWAEPKIHVIYNGISQDFQPISIDSKTDTILYVGSLQERKNFMAVLQAFECLQSISDKYKLTMIGKWSNIFAMNETSLAILQKAKQNPKIEFFDSVSIEELKWHYTHARVFVFPSYYEGFGFPPLEAMASGTPVIVSNTSSLPEVCGDAALFIDPNNIEELTAKIQYVLNNTHIQRNMIEKGLRQAKKFTWADTAKQYISIFEKVIS